MTTEELKAIVENIESIKFLLDERDLDSQALQVELAGLHEIIVKLMDEQTAWACKTLQGLPASTDGRYFPTRFQYRDEFQQMRRCGAAGAYAHPCCSAMGRRYEFHARLQRHRCYQPEHDRTVWPAQTNKS